MSSILPLPSTPTPSASSPDVGAIMPGTIFQDEIPPSFVDGTGPERYSPSSAPSGNGSRAQIDVNPTIQIVLISLGIVVGALFLLGIAAAYYIARKNKLANMKKEEGKSLPPIPEASAADLESGLGPYTASDRRLQHASSFSSNAMLLSTEKDGSVCDSTGYGHSRSSTPATISYPTTTVSQPGATGFTAAAGVRSHGQNKRNSYIDVAQAYSRRQSQSYIISPAVMAHRMSMALDPSITGTGSIDIYTGIPAYFLSQSAFTSTTLPSSSVGSGDPYDQCSGPTALASPQLSVASSAFFPNDHSMANNNDPVRVDQSIKCASGSSTPPPVPSKDCSPLNSPHSSLSIGFTGTPISASMVRPVNTGAAMTPDISYQPPSQPTSPSTPAFDRGASRRSSTAFTAANGSRHEGSPWHRKRASVVIPDRAAPVRLWKGDVAAVSTANDSPSSDSSMAGPSRVRVFSSQDELQSRYQSYGVSRVARDGAAVFEGVALHRSAIKQRRSLEESSTRSQTFPRRWAAGQIAVDDEEMVQDGQHGWVPSPQDAGSVIPYRHHSNGASLDESSEEKVVISLPSPHGCLLEDEVEALEIQDACSWQHQQRQTHTQSDEEGATGEDISALEHPNPTVVKRKPKHLRDKVISSYLDDYREQQQQQEHRKSSRQSVANDGEMSEGSASGSHSGRKRSVGLFQSALQRASLYSSGRSSPPPVPAPETASFPGILPCKSDTEETILSSN
ncbi:hypothetical protein BGZ68_007394 [Mortierella alpina]|nr:hypothetical protein BGZ68_007394 [Mortierella alpina]